MFEKQKVKIRVYSGSTVGPAADIALKNRMYVSGWSLSGELKRIRDRFHANDCKIALAWYGDIPLAVAVINDGSVQAFCRKAFRRNGLASRCVSAVKRTSCTADLGIVGSSAFWTKHNIFCY